MTVSMGMLIFAGLAYALEKDERDTTFYTLPQTLYWAIITMTSTGTVQYSTGADMCSIDTLGVKGSDFCLRGEFCERTEEYRAF